MPRAGAWKTSSNGATKPPNCSPPTMRSGTRHGRRRSRTARQPDELCASREMKLLPLRAPDHLELAMAWLAQKENYQWLDFGNGRQIGTLALLKIMTQHASHFFPLYTTNPEDPPIGLGGSNNAKPVFKTAT